MGKVSPNKPVKWGSLEATPTPALLMELKRRYAVMVFAGMRVGEGNQEQTDIMLKAKTKPWLEAALAAAGELAAKEYKEPPPDLTDAVGEAGMPGVWK